MTPLRKPLRLKRGQGWQSKPVREQPAATALHDRVDEQAVLVDESRGDQSVAQGDAASNDDVVARLLLHPANLPHRITAEHGGVTARPPRSVLCLTSGNAARIRSASAKCSPAAALGGWVFMGRARFRSRPRLDAQNSGRGRQSWSCSVQDSSPHSAPT